MNAEKVGGCTGCTRFSRWHGFTVMELMMTMAVAAVLLAIGVPGFTRLSLDNQRAAALNDIAWSLNFARATALTERSTVVICRSSRSPSESPSCIEDGLRGWEEGWIIFVDDNRNGIHEPNEPVLRQHGPLPPGTTLRGNSKLADSISFGEHGGTVNNGRLVYCDRRGWSDDVRIMVVATSGRIRVTTAIGDGNASLGGCLA